ncbi:elongator complex protein 6 [Anticarsia gemmatalis]|uniref:elongator complex protein 6 n=1 Tax=Anticarsia gemmatalis TaxID=129554 RepID=UPI003F772629
MSSDIITLLQLDKALSSRVVVVKEINRCDSSFITSCVLNHCIKNKIGIVVVSTHNSLQHYQNVGLRMNYNLQRYLDTGLVDFFNFGEYSTNNLLMDNNLPELLPQVKEKILSMQQKHQTVSVILDGISHLFDLNYSLRQVNMFCKELIELVTSYNNSFVVCHCNEANEDDVTCVMSNLLSHKAHTVLEVENLPSGLSADVSGHLTIKYPGLKFDNNHLYTLDIKPSKYLFKLFDRGVKLLAPGTV